MVLKWCGVHSEFQDLHLGLQFARPGYNITAPRQALDNENTFTGEQAEFFRCIKMNKTFTPLYEPFSLNHDPVFDRGPVLFYCGSENRQGLTLDVTNNKAVTVITIKVSDSAQAAPLYGTWHKSLGGACGYQTKD